MEQEPILHVWMHKDNDLVDLTISTKTHAPHSATVTTSQETIHTNQKHPFLTEEKGFRPVAQITLGMHILRADGRVGIITDRKVVPGVKTMYNLEVQQDHTFTVGAGQWVVHNECINGPTFPNDNSTVGHIFRNAPGHLVDDTSANRQLFTDTSADSSNYVGTDGYNNDWYTQTLPNGSQVWVRVRNGVITDAGVNNAPWSWDPAKGRLVP